MADWKALARFGGAVALVLGLVSSTDRVAFTQVKTNVPDVVPGAA